MRLPDTLLVNAKSCNWGKRTTSHLTCTGAVKGLHGTALHCIADHLNIGDAILQELAVHPHYPYYVHWLRKLPSGIKPRVGCWLLCLPAQKIVQKSRSLDAKIPRWPLPSVPAAAGSQSEACCAVCVQLSTAALVSHTAACSSG